MHFSLYVCYFIQGKNCNKNYQFCLIFLWCYYVLMKIYCLRLWSIVILYSLFYELRIVLNWAKTGLQKSLFVLILLLLLRWWIPGNPSHIKTNSNLKDYERLLCIYYSSKMDEFYSKLLNHSEITEFSNWLSPTTLTILKFMTIFNIALAKW